MYGSSDVIGLKRGEKVPRRSRRERLLGLHLALTPVLHLGTARGEPSKILRNSPVSARLSNEERVAVECSQMRLETLDKHPALTQTSSIIQICSCSPFGQALAR